MDNVDIVCQLKGRCLGCNSQFGEGEIFSEHALCFPDCPLGASAAIEGHIPCELSVCGAGTGHSVPVMGSCPSEPSARQLHQL